MFSQDRQKAAMNTGLDIDDALIRALYADSAYAKALLDRLASGGYDQPEISVDRLEGDMAAEGSHIPRAAITRVFQTLEKARAGRYVVGRRGHPSRFETDVDLRSLGLWASGETDQIERLRQLSAGGPVHGADEALQHVPAAEPDLETYVFPLRPDLDVSLALPRDLSSQESLRLADFIKSLPFDARSDGGR